MCGVGLNDWKISADLMFMLGLSETIDQLAMANSVWWWYGHVLKRENGHVLRREDGHVLKRENGHVLRREDGHVLREGERSCAEEGGWSCVERGRTVMCWGGRMVMCWRGRTVMFCEGHKILKLKVKGRKGGRREHEKSRLRKKVWRLVWEWKMHFADGSGVLA